jgi:hypothetical protein
MPNIRGQFGLPMRDWQGEVSINSASSRFSVFALHRRAGKTELALKKLLNAAAIANLDLPMFLYVAPFLRQAKLIAWSRLKQMVGPIVGTGQVEINESELSVKFKHNGAVVRLLGGDNPDASRGVRLDGLVIDEVAQIKPEVWEEILQPALSDRKGWAWFIGTPSGINLFSQLFMAAKDRDNWYAARYTVYETDAIDPQEVERLRETMSEQAFNREYLCDFAAAGDNQLLSLTDIDVAADRSHRPGSMDYAPVILGVDPARFGDDRSVIFRRQGLQAFEPLVYRGIDNMELAARVAEQIQLHEADGVFIDAGAGSGVIDRLRQLGFDVFEVNFGGKATSPRYNNKRTEMWHTLADAIRAGLAIPNALDLKIELATPVYKYDAANRIVLESKDDIRKRLPDAGSPDLADALALTYAHPVVKQQRQRDYTPSPEYNPYNELAI